MPNQTAALGIGRSLTHRLLESAQRLEQSRAARWIAQAQDFAL
jgi:hypothetical protein